MERRNLSRSRRAASALAASLAVFLAAATGSRAQVCSEGEIVPGRIVADAVFESAQLIRPYLDANPVVEPYWGDPVRARVGWREVARGSYVPVNTWEVNDRVAASFDLTPDLGWGDSFSLSIETVRFEDGAYYLFGSPNSNTALSHLCSGVLPIVDEPAGTRCDLREPVSLLEVTFRLEGSAIPRLDASQPAWCSVSAYVQDAPFTGAWPWSQATSPGDNVSVADLTGAGETVPLLVRRIPEIELVAYCSASINPGPPCLVVDADSERAQVSGAITIDPRTELSPEIVIQAECTAGAVEGALDVVGHDVVASQVWLGRNGSDVAFDTTEPAPTADSPRFEWRFGGFPEGMHAARAWAVLDDRSAFLRLPAKDGLNGPVLVLAEETTELGNTFVTRPVAVQGDVFLSDLGSGALSTLSLGPLETDHWVPWEGYANPDPDRGEENPHSFMEAKGAVRIAADSHSGLEGLARAQLMGTYDATTGEASLDYTLLLGGLSPAGGAADGSGAFPTPWDISRLHLRFGYPGGWEQLRVGLADAGLAFAALSPGEGPVTAPTQDVCVAEAQLKLRIEPSIGAVSRPGARVETTGPFYGASNSSVLLDVKGRLDPEWGDSPAPAPEVGLPLRLPAGFIYEVSPAVDVTVGAPVGSTTRANLPSLRLPESAPLRCGDEHGTCLRLGCGETYEALGVEVLAADGLAPAPSCLAGTAADFAIRVTDTEGLAPSRVSYALDPSGEYCGPSPTVLCDGDCPVDPVFPITVSGLSPGVHRVAACAGFESDPFCAHHSAAFAVEALTCPSDFRVLLDPGEADVAASDPRITGNLQASVSGCGASVPVTDDRPGSFPPGVTTVQFAAGGAGACQTRVTVIPSALSLKHQRPPAVDSLLELFAPLTLPSSLAGRVPVGSSPLAYLLGEDGRATVVGPSGLANVRFSAAAPTWHTIGLPTGPWRLALHPNRPFLAVLGRPGAVGPWTIKVVQGTQVLGTAPIPPLPGYQQSLTAIGWSPDGHRLAVAGVARATGVGPGPVYVAHVWDLSTPTSPIGPATTTHPAPSNAVVHEILLRASDLLVASGRGLYRLDPGWNPVYLRGNLDMVIGPGGESVILASLEPTAKIRLVYRTFGPAGETREGPELLRTKMGTSEIAVTGDGRFAAITTYVGMTGNMAVPVFELESLSATSPPVAAVLTEFDGSDPQFRR